MYIWGTPRISHWLLDPPVTLLQIIIEKNKKQKTKNEKKSTQYLISICTCSEQICFTNMRFIGQPLMIFKTRFYLICFFPHAGEDFNIIQQEIAILSDCKNPNIVGYHGSYLR